MTESSKITLRLLNEVNSINQYIDNFEFFAGEDRILKFQLWHEANDAAYTITDTDTVNVILKQKNGFNLTKLAVIDSLNKSILSVNLSKAETEMLISHDILAEIIESGSTRLAEQKSPSLGMVLLRK